MSSRMLRYAAWGSLVLAVAVVSLAAGRRAGADDGAGTKSVTPPLVKGARMDPAERAAFSKLLAKSPTALRDTPLALLHKGTADYVNVDVEFADPVSCAKFDLKGAYVYHRSDVFANLFIEVGPEGEAALKALDENQVAGQVWRDISNRLSIAPPPKRDTVLSGDLPDPIVRGGVGNLTGKGVIVAVIDTGVDFRHPDFITTDADGKPVSRLLYFWDTFSEEKPAGEGTEPPVTGPDGKPLGRVYTRDELTAELRDPHGLLKDPDEGGHGTCCAGVAAGNGRALEGKYTGVAPDADIIAVRAGGYHGSRYIENAFLLPAACAWLSRVAGKRPLVVSCSFGGDLSGHDGYRVEERELNNLFAPEAKGRALCIAAGNGRDDGTHAALKFAGKDAAATLKWKAQGSAVLRLYLDGAKADDVRVETAAGAAERVKAYVHPLSETLILEVSDLGGATDLRVWSDSGERLSGDAYLLGLGGPAAFDKSVATKGYKISSPGTTWNAVTVGSYDFNDLFHQGGELKRLAAPNGEALELGALSFYSNPGPTRKDNRVKPEVVAPGQYFTAPAIKSTPQEYLDTSGKYEFFNGTSAATPYTAGVLALLFQAKPDCTAKEAKERLTKCAVSDKFTGEVPNGEWGHGKLNKKAVEALLKAAE